MSTGIVAALVLTQRNGIKVEDLIEKFSWLKELIIAKGAFDRVVVLNLLFSSLTPESQSCFRRLERPHSAPGELRGDAGHQAPAAPDH